MSQFSPYFLNSSFSLTTSLTENGRFLAIQPKAIPKSVFEFLVYTKNDTYIEFIEKFDCGKLSNPNDFDVSSRIINKNSRDHLIIILDDLPEGSSINSNVIHRNASVLLIVFKIEFIDKFVYYIRNYHDMEPIEFAEFLTQFLSQYPESLNVKSDKKIQITTNHEKIAFNKSQIISQEKTISFQNKNTIVTFSNLTFKGNSPIGTLTKVVTDHILIECGASAKVLSHLEVKEYFEFEPKSSLKANLILP